eukprot:2427097-Rhodomonas_salina.2
MNKTMRRRQLSVEQILCCTFSVSGWAEEWSAVILKHTPSMCEFGIHETVMQSVNFIQELSVLLSVFVRNAARQQTTNNSMHNLAAPRYLHTALTCSGSACPPSCLLFPSSMFTERN